MKQKATKILVRQTVIRDRATGRFATKVHPLRSGWTYIWSWRWVDGPNAGKFATGDSK